MNNTTILDILETFKTEIVEVGPSDSDGTWYADLSPTWPNEDSNTFLQITIEFARPANGRFDFEDFQLEVTRFVGCVATGSDLDDDGETTELFDATGPQVSNLLGDFIALLTA